MKITSAIKQKNNPNMIQIHIDDSYAFSIPEEEYIRMNLYEKQELNSEEIRVIREEVNVQFAKQRALRILTIRYRTEYEIKEKLTSLGFDIESVDAAILQLKSMGYINDRLFATKYISDRLKLKPRSKRALNFELKKKGISPDIIEQVIDEFEIDESVIAYRLARKKYGKYDMDDQKIQRRVISFLSHKGFSYEIIKGAMEQMKEEQIW
ncbi:MAG TPA: regulatory protein RecX [Thermoclostridium sp.]|nr:regulatory protein RecX [Thermoclostridium sp.]